MLTLARALRIPPASYLAIVGAGGKTSALFTLAHDVAPCAVSTTTHVGAWQTTQADRVWSWPPEAGTLPNRLPDGITFVGGLLDRGTNRYPAPPDAWLARLARLAREQSVPLLVEADGARGRPLKAPAAHEPLIAAETSMVLVVAGISGIGRPLDDLSVHRAELFGRLSGLPAGAPVTPEAIVRVLTDVHGGLKNIPPTARRAVLLNQADRQESRSMAVAMARALVPPFDSVVVSSGDDGSADDGSHLRRLSALEVRAPVAGIVLAAGGARRFGRPKQLAEYRGKPFARVVVETALTAGLSPVHVVIGAYGALVERALDGLPVTTVVNPDWEAGQAASVVAGVRALPAATSAAVFLQADQPRVPPVLVAALVDRHAQGLFPIVAPLVDGRPLSPVLFDRTTFPDLLMLTGDRGGRALWDTWGVEGVVWHDPSVLVDIDTPADYRAMTRSGGH